MIQENILNPNPTLQNIKNAINTVNENAVKISGDTMTGNLKIQKEEDIYVQGIRPDIIRGNTSNIDKDVALFGGKDSQNNYIAYFDAVYTSTGVSKAYISAANAGEENVLSLNLDSDGNKSVTLSEPEIWPFVQKTGDIMTGDLKIKASSTQAKLDLYGNIQINNTSTWTQFGSVAFKDSTSTIAGYITGIGTSTDGMNATGIRILTREYNDNDEEQDNFLDLYVKKNGDKIVSIPSDAKQPWRNALGLGTISTSNSNDYLPITGGTLTEVLKLQTLNADVTTTASTVTERYYKVVDKNDSSFSLFGGSQSTNGDVYTSVIAQRRDQDNQNVQNYLYLITTSTGEKRISVSDPIAWRNALIPTQEQKALWKKHLGYLGMSFDEAPDTRNINNSVTIPSTANLNTLEYCTTGKYYCALDTANVQKIQNCPTKVGFQMLVFKIFGGTTGGTNIALTVDSTWKTHLRVLMDYKGQVWTQQILVENSAITYGSWQPLYEYSDECTYTSTSLFSGTFRFRRANKWVQMTCVDFNPKVEITDSSWVDIGSFTTNTNFLPLYNTTIGIGSRTITNANGMLQVKTNGHLSFTGYKGNSISTGATYVMSATYIAQN